MAINSAPLSVVRLGWGRGAPFLICGCSYYSQAWRCFCSCFLHLQLGCVSLGWIFLPSRWCFPEAWGKKCNFPERGSTLEAFPCVEQNTSFSGFPCNLCLCLFVVILRYCHLFHFIILMFLQLALRIQDQVYLPFNSHPSKCLAHYIQMFINVLNK